MNHIGSQDKAETKFDAQAFAMNIARAMESSGQALAAYLKPRETGEVKDRPPSELAEVVKTFSSVAEYWMSDKERAADLQHKMGKAYLDLWGSAARRMAGEQEVKPAAAPSPRDKRFQDPEWKSNQFFDFMMQLYLLTTQWAHDLVRNAEGLDPHTRKKAEFYVQQITNALSPSNFVLTNPEVLRETLASKGDNLVRGMKMLAEDIEAGRGTLRIRQSDPGNLEVGVNMATTPGKVIYQNDLMQLIQYSPSTETVLRTPLLIVPPWINKFYILDLQPKNSMIKWLTDQGHTVFLVSWVNPDEDMADATFEDYMREGVYAATQAVKEAASVNRMNAVGYCIGGTLLSAALAHMAKTGDTSIQSATFFAAQADFKLAGDLLIFSDDKAIEYLEEKMDQAGGVLDAQTMADTFNSLRSNDLIWNYVVDNYYVGKQPPPFDLLYWNADQTRMPKALHLFYLRKFYRDNALTEGKLDLLGEHLSLKDVKIPIFMQSSKEDHIAPAASVYRTALSFGGAVEYIIAGSGHIAGVINHPAAHKYQYWTNPNLKGALEDWQAFATEHPGSWWPHWDAWLRKLSGPDVPARHPGDGELQPLGDAPGEYVKVRSSAA